MKPPVLSVDQVQRILPSASDIKEIDRGGQKVVFTALIEGERYAIKFLCPQFVPTDEDSESTLDVVAARANREVATMRQCSSPYLVEMGPIGIENIDLDGMSLIYFSEKFIDGTNLSRYLKDYGLLAVPDLVRLGFQISSAIGAIWQFSKVHRDVKPGNIMHRETTGDFVLLDMGLVLDLDDASLSVSPVGTPLYLSPEQTDFKNRRSVMTFRSDLFSLGIVMYEMATGRHPFLTSTTNTSWDVIANISTITPANPKQFRPELPDKLCETILRLLAKRPALRFRSISMFHDALSQIPIIGGITNE